jgi:hypothetical protein
MRPLEILIPILLATHLLWRRPRLFGFGIFLYSHRSS